MPASVYLRRLDSLLGAPVIDGEVAVAVLDWGRVGAGSGPEEVYALAGLSDGLPQDLVAAGRSEISGVLGTDTPCVVPGPERPWVWASAGRRAGEVGRYRGGPYASGGEVTVVYEDFTYLADAPPSGAEGWAELAAWATVGVCALGPAGRRAAVGEWESFFRHHAPAWSVSGFCATVSAGLAVEPFTRSGRRRWAGAGR